MVYRTVFDTGTTTTQDHFFDMIGTKGHRAAVHPVPHLNCERVAMKLKNNNKTLPPNPYFVLIL